MAESISLPDDMPPEQASRVWRDFDDTVKLTLDPATRDLITDALIEAVNFEPNEADDQGYVDTLIPAQGNGFLDTFLDNGSWLKVYSATMHMSERQASRLSRSLLQYAEVRLLPVELGIANEDDQQTRQQIVQAQAAAGLAAELINPPYDTTDIYEASGITPPTPETVDNAIEQILRQDEMARQRAESTPQVDVIPYFARPIDYQPQISHKEGRRIAEDLRKWRPRTEFRQHEYINKLPTPDYLLNTPLMDIDPEAFKRNLEKYSRQRGFPPARLFSEDDPSQDIN